LGPIRPVASFFCGMLARSKYERGSPSYYNIPAGLKNVDVRRV